MLTKVGIKGYINYMEKINITLPLDFLKKIDKTAEKEKVSRSEFFRKAVLTYFDVKKAKALEKKRVKNIMEAIQTQDDLRKIAGDYDSSAEVHKWREKRYGKGSI